MASKYTAKLRERNHIPSHKIDDIPVAVDDNIAGERTPSSLVHTSPVVLNGVLAKFSFLQVPILMFQFHCFI